MAEILKYSDTGEKQLPILFFLHGWPDTGELWQKQVEYFKEKYRCVCVTLPAYDPTDGEKPIDFPELTQRIKATIDHVRGEDPKPLVLVGHDWGAYLTYIVDRTYPDVAHKLITMDVGGHFKPKNLRHLLFMLNYQAWLIAAYFLGKPLPAVGKAMSGKLSSLARAPRGKNVESKSNYLYYYFWRSRLTRSYGVELHKSYRPRKPLLYLYGTRKPFHFHSDEWLKRVEETPGSKVVALNANHWLMQRAPNETNEAMADFLAQT